MGANKIVPNDKITNQKELLIGGKNKKICNICNKMQFC